MKAQSRTDGAVPAYDCRLVGPKDSVMSDERDAYAATLGKTFRKSWVMKIAGWSVYPDHQETKLETSVPIRKNLLYPAEFYRIIDSNPCTRGQDIYSQCLVGAYVTSAFEACPKRPDVCDDPDFAWLK